MDESYLTEASWYLITHNVGFTGDSEEYHLISIDLGQKFKVALVQAQGTSDVAASGKLRGLEILVGMEAPEPIQTQEGRYFSREREKNLMTCGYMDISRPRVHMVFPIPCRCVIPGRFIWVRIQGVGARLIRVGVWKAIM